MTSTVSAAGFMEPRHRYAWAAGCRTPDSIRMPLDGLLKAAEKEGGSAGRPEHKSPPICMDFAAERYWPAAAQIGVFCATAHPAVRPAAGRRTAEG
jgi:hypothetical protein